MRIRRRLIDRVGSLVRPMHRYRCTNELCQWEGNLRAPHAEGGEAQRQSGL